MWQWLMTDVTTVAKDVLELNQNRPEKQVYMSLPRPGVSEFPLSCRRYIVRFNVQELPYIISDLFMSNIQSEVAHLVISRMDDRLDPIIHSIL